MIFNKDKENKYGLIIPDIKDNLKMEKGTEKVNIQCIQVLFMMGNGNKANLMVKVFILGLMAENIKVNGRIIA